MTHIHVPTPGDHYSPATGSAIMTVVYELARRHAERGLRSQIIVARGTRRDYPVGDCIEVDLGPLPSTSRKVAETAVAWLGGSRPFTSAAYRPALQAVDPGFDGTLFLHNSPGAVPLFAGRRGDARVCLYTHNDVFRLYGRREIRRTVAAAHRVICVSRFMADRLMARIGREVENVQPVHNGVDTERFTPREGGLPGGEPLVLFVGRMVPYKGVDLLLRAAVKVASRRRRFRVRVVGSSGFSSTSSLSPYELELRRMARPLGDRVEFRPFVDRDRVLEEYRAASVFCIPSNWDEPCSLTLPEAMACGLPAVASCRGGIPEVGGDAALYFSPPDVDQLADRLSYLIDDEAARTDLGRRSRQQALTLSWEGRYRRLVTALGEART